MFDIKRKNGRIHSPSDGVLYGSKTKFSHLMQVDLIIVRRAEQKDDIMQI